MVRIAVCVKQVPEVSELTLDPVTRRLRRDGVPALINPFDRRAVLEALRLRDEIGGTVTVVSMGPPQAEAALRECLGLGVDRAVHLSDARFAGADTLATARALARAIASVGADLVLAGRYSIDAETGQVPPEIAEILGIEFLGGVRRLSLTAVGDAPSPGALELRVECEGDDGAVEIACFLPALVTCTDRWKTRAPIVMPDDERVLAGRVERLTAGDLGGAPDEYGQAGSPTWVAEVRPVDLGRARRLVDARADLGVGVAAAMAAIETARASAHAGAGAGDHSPRHARRPDPVGAIWVLAERTIAGGLRPVSLELLAAADRLALELGLGVAAVVAEPLPRTLLGGARGAAGAAVDTDVSSIATRLGRAGADCLLVSAHGEAVHPEELVGSLAAAIGNLSPRMLLAPATALGRDLVPALAARLGLGLTGDAIGVELDADGRLLQLKPAFGGQVVAPILSRTRPEVVTLRPGTVAPATEDASRPAAEVVAALACSARSRARWLAFSPELSDVGVPIEAAQAIVCVGFGLGSRDRLPQAEALARALGGAVGATRRVCDAGWVPRQLQIGLSGRNVAPALYLALGVRGSFNHIVGLRRAGTVIAVNRDPEAEFFAAADLGIVADAPAFLAALNERLGVSG